MTRAIAKPRDVVEVEVVIEGGGRCLAIGEAGDKEKDVVGRAWHERASKVR